MSDIPNGTLYIEAAGHGRRPVLEDCTIGDANEKIQEIDRLYERATDCDGNEEAHAELMREWPDYYGSYFIFVDITGQERMFAGGQGDVSIWKIL